jgi:signal transduction histidine kinase
MGKGPPRIRSSVFVKLVAIMLTMAATLLLMVTGFFALIVYPNMTFMTEGLIDEYTRAVAASLPDLAAAKKLSTRLDVQIRYEGPDGVWATTGDLPSITKVRKGEAGGFSDGREYSVESAPNGGAYLFAWNFQQRMHGVHAKLLWLLLLLMLGVVFCAYAVQRRLLRPVRWLDEGVARLSAGHLYVSLPVVSRDEFGALTVAFNRMVRQVAQMVQARDQLLLDVSHELRSPLTRLKVALEFVPEGENRAHIAADISEMELMIAELLELERLRNGRGIRMVRQDLLPILHEVAGSFRDKWPGVRVIAIEREIFLNIDGDKLRTVLRNILENAFKYSLPDSRPVEVSTSQNGDMTVVRVSDDGPGIPDSDMESIFEPFFRVDRSRSKKSGGYGLGLSICKRILEAHGGSVGVERNPGRGVSFILSLPKRA